MKKFTKLLGIVLIIALVMSLGTMAFAAPTQVDLSVNAVDGHTYTAYQLFVGDLAADGKTLSNVKWGSNAASSISYKTKDAGGDFTVDATVSTSPGQAVPQAVLDYLASLASKTNPVTQTPTGVAQTTANIISNWVSGTGTTITSTAVQVDTGYYVVKDAYTDATADQTTTLSTVVCEVVGPTTIAPKFGTTTHKKDVLDVNDSTATLDFSNLKNVAEADWLKFADHDIGDKVPFRLTTKIGSDFAKYTSYVLKVHDTLGAGLTLNEDSIEVYVDGQKATKGDAAGQYTVTAPGTGGESFVVAFNNLSANTNAGADKDVVVYYTATLTGDNVVIGNPGNPNTSYAEFSNNPNGDQSGTGNTPPDTVVVFTYKMDVDKIAKNATGTAYVAKEGAGFTLYKQYAAEDSTKTNAAESLGKAATQFWYAVGAEVKNVTNFEFKGLDDGNYILVETTTPDGYNTMANLEFSITATIDSSTTQTYKYEIQTLSGPTGYVASPNGGTFTFVRDKADGTGTENVTTKIDGTTTDLVSGEIFGQIINQSGTILPSTGGIGTTIFYVVGSILVVAAGVLLITKKRMGRE